MKLLKLFRKKPFCNDFHFLLIAVILLLVSVKYWPFYIILGLYLVFLFLKTRMLIPVLCLLCLFEAELFLKTEMKSMEIPSKITCTVTEVENDHSYTVRYKLIKIRVTEYDHENRPGNRIVLSLELNEETLKSYEADFDYEEYLLSKGVSHSAKGKTLEKKSEGFSLKSLKYYYLSYLSDHLSEDSLAYVKAMVFADNDLDTEVKDAYSVLGISHILAVSGLHILFLFRILSFLCLKLFHQYRKTIPLALVFLFTILIGAPASAMRAVLFLLLGELNKKGDATYTRLDILSISCILMLLLNPYQIYGSGFMLSYLVSFVLIFQEGVPKKSGKLAGSYKTYYLIYFATFPIASGFSNEISLLSFLLSPLLTLVVSFLILPISYVLAIVPVTDCIFRYVFSFLNSYLLGITKYNLTLSVPSFTVYQALAYYILFLLLIYAILKRKYIAPAVASLALFLLAFMEIRYLNPSCRVTFLDCGQGDSAVISLPYGKGTMVIDAFHSHDYLKSTGISRIDILVLTHSDSDHIGDYEEILEDFDVGMVYYPEYDDKFDELLADVKDKKGITYLATLGLSGTEIEVLGPVNRYENVNSNSVVLKMKLEGTTFLFTGDMTLEEEADLCSLYGNKLDCDVLKVGHHGSSTSSGEEFLSLASPSVSVISVGQNNSYGLPDDAVVDRLKAMSKVYMTMNTGNITFTLRNNKVWINTYR